MGMQLPSGASPVTAPSLAAVAIRIELELELEQIQTHMTQKPLLLVEVGARTVRKRS
jgi:hypothetical protein